MERARGAIGIGLHESYIKFRLGSAPRAPPSPQETSCKPIPIASAEERAPCGVREL